MVSPVVPQSDEHTLLLSNTDDTSHQTEIPVSSHDAPESNLHRFREAIGINTSASGEDRDLESARNEAKGLYKEIIGLQRTRYRQYHTVNTAYYLALGAQVLIGALVASLGPLSKLLPTVITILGVLNASLAGVLALLKGQGLPDRLRKDEYQMQTVQDFIEETDIRLGLSANDITRQELGELVEQVFEKYHTARDIVEMNKTMSYAHPSQVDGASGGPARKNFTLWKGGQKAKLLL